MIARLKDRVIIIIIIIKAIRLTWYKCKSTANHVTIHDVKTHG